MLLTLHDPSRAREFYEQGLWRADTLYSLLADHANERANAYALRDSKHRLTWRELKDWVDAVAHDLDQADVPPGGRVSIWLPNRVESFVTFLACSRNGYVCNSSLHQNYTVAEIVELLRGIQSSALVTQAGYGANGNDQNIFALAAELPSMKRIYQASSSINGLAGWPTARGRQGAAFPLPGDRPPPGFQPNTNPDKIVYLAFTSGTTSMPKGLMHSDNTLLANGRAMVKDWHHDANTILLSLSPVSHHIATVALEQGLVAGCELVLNDPPPGMSALDWILDSGATYVMGVPTHAIDIQAAMKQRSLKRLGNVKVFYMAGAPIPEETARTFLDQGILPQKVYGMTENGSHQYTLPSDDRDTIVKTCGRSCDVYEVKIFSQENENIEAKPGEVGEIGGRGAMLMLGYFDNQSATENSFNRDGYLMSGDLGWLDERGNLYFVGRKKDLIIRGGHNIFPARIEDLAHRHPQVQKAAAFPVADARLGEKVCLAIIARDNTKLDAYVLLDHLYQSGLSKFDMPEYFTQLDAFPLTASGKVLKRELVEWAKSGRIVPTPVRWVDPAKAKEA
jgi:acyl-CoA synthetase